MIDSPSYRNDQAVSDYRYFLALLRAGYRFQMEPSGKIKLMERKDGTTWRHYMNICPGCTQCWVPHETWIACEESEIFCNSCWSWTNPPYETEEDGAKIRHEEIGKFKRWLVVHRTTGRNDDPGAGASGFPVFHPSPRASIPRHSPPPSPRKRSRDPEPP